MKTVVCVKYFEGDINPFDECALECALSVSDDVTVVSMGPLSVCERIRELTRLGVKRVILLSDPAFAGADTLATANALATCIKTINPDIVFCGRQSIDGDTAQVGPELSVMLGYNLITNTIKFGTEFCETRTGTERVVMPVVMTIERINKLRFPSILSRLGDVEIWDADKLGGKKSQYGTTGSPTRVLKTFKSERGSRKCKFIDKSDLKAVLSELKNKQDNNIEITKSETPLKEVWAVGTAVAEKAKQIASKVNIICETDISAIVEIIRKEKSEIVLWPANLWGRKYAPVAAAMLCTGLCADCTALETDGTELFMYRPARSGDVYAKIISTSFPKMATVRISENSEDFIISGGRGVHGKFNQLREYAKKLGAEVAASRPIVDSNEALYEEQVGLTGKNVSPKIYMAIGISGAVQHVCAIENAETVIAINPDKDAEIFRYADYGIICSFEELLDADVN